MHPSIFPTRDARAAGLVALALVLLPASSESQLVVRDDVDGWGWLAVVTDRLAIAQLAHASPQSGAQARLDAELVAELRGRGVRRLFDQSSFEAAESSVLAVCTATDWTPEGSSSVQFALLVEVSYWDHTRLAATEIYESITLGSTPRETYSPTAYVQGCAGVLAGVLIRLGFDRG